MVMHCTFEWILYWINDIISLKINLSLLQIYLGMTYRQQRNQFKYSFVCDNGVESSFVSGCCKTIDFFHSATKTADFDTFKSCTYLILELKYALMILCKQEQQLFQTLSYIIVNFLTSQT